MSLSKIDQADQENKRRKEEGDLPRLVVFKTNGQVDMIPWAGKLIDGMPPFKELYKLMEDPCTIIERVRIPFTRWYLWVDEDGLAKGLKFNSEASALTGRHIVGTGIVWTGEIE